LSVRCKSSTVLYDFTVRSENLTGAEIGNFYFLVWLVTGSKWPISLVKKLAYVVFKNDLFSEVLNPFKNDNNVKVEEENFLGACRKWTICFNKPLKNTLTTDQIILRFLLLARTIISGFDTFAKTGRQLCTFRKRFLRILKIPCFCNYFDQGRKVSSSVYTLNSVMPLGLRIIRMPRIWEKSAIWQNLVFKKSFPYYVVHVRRPKTSQNGHFWHFPKIWPPRNFSGAR